MACVNVPKRNYLFSLRHLFWQFIKLRNLEVVPEEASEEHGHKGPGDEDEEEQSLVHPASCNEYIKAVERRCCKDSNHLPNNMKNDFLFLIWKYSQFLQMIYNRLDASPSKNTKLISYNPILKNFILVCHSAFPLKHQKSTNDVGNNC